MIVRRRPLAEGARRLCLAVCLYDAILRRASPHLSAAPLTAEEGELIDRKRAEAVVEIGRHTRAEVAVRRLQSVIRGAARRAAIASRRPAAAAGRASRR